MLTIKPYGMLVKVSEQIRGLVPPMHLADIPMKNPEKKYHIGNEVTCRVSLLMGVCWGFGHMGREQCFSDEVFALFHKMTM